MFRKWYTLSDWVREKSGSVVFCRQASSIKNASGDFLRLFIVQKSLQLMDLAGLVLSPMKIGPSVNFQNFQFQLTFAEVLLLWRKRGGVGRLRQGCQMVDFHTKNHDLGIFWRALEWKMLVYPTTICSIIMLFGIFCGHLVYCTVIWYIFHVLVSCSKKNLATLVCARILIEILNRRKWVLRLKTPTSQPWTKTRPKKTSFNLLPPEQGCQMVSFQTKNPFLGKFWRSLDWKMFIYFMTIWNMLGTFGIFYDHLVHLCSFGTFVFIWYIFPVLV
jgi:hypothetical protein